MTSVGAALLVSVAAANAQTIDLDGSGLPGALPTADVDSDSPDTAISNVNNNDADITATIEGITVTIIADDIDQADAEINDNSATALTAGNNATNLIDTGDSGQAPTNIALIGNVNTVTGGATIESEITAVEFIIDGSDGNVIGDSDLEIIGNTVLAFADANVADNQIVGNFDDLAEADSPPGDFNLGVDAEGATVDAEGNFVIGNLQFTQGNVAVDSTIDDLTISITNLDTTGAAAGTFPDAADIRNSEASTRARGNVAVNAIRGQNDGDLNSFGIASLQLNSADITAETTNVLMSIELDGSLDQMNAEVSDNVISATAAGNVVNNTISFAD